MNQLSYPWEGRPTFVRSAVVRGSAAGSSYSGVRLHKYVGMNGRGQPVAGCGLVFHGNVVFTGKQGDLTLCDRPGCAE